MLSENPKTNSDESINPLEKAYTYEKNLAKDQCHNNLDTLVAEINAATSGVELDSAAATEEPAANFNTENTSYSPVAALDSTNLPKSNLNQLVAEMEAAIPKDFGFKYFSA